MYIFPSLLLRIWTNNGWQESGHSSRKTIDNTIKEVWKWYRRGNCRVLKEHDTYAVAYRNVTSMVLPKSFGLSQMAATSFRGDSYTPVIVFWK